MKYNPLSTKRLSLQAGGWQALNAAADHSTTRPLLDWKIPRNLIGYLRIRGVLAILNSVTPFFIVDDLRATLAFYQSKLGFDVRYKGGGDGNADDDFWAILGRDRVMLMFKAITPEVHPQPNRSRHEWAPWDACIYTAGGRPLTTTATIDPQRTLGWPTLCDFAVCKGWGCFSLASKRFGSGHRGGARVMPGTVSFRLPRIRFSPKVEP